MGRLVNGVWTADPDWKDQKRKEFRRAPTTFRDWITPDGRPGPDRQRGFPAASGRYHLYVSLACPWAHRTLIFRQLKGLTDHVPVSIVHPEMYDLGWTFQKDGLAEGDALYGLDFLYQIYQKSDPGVTSRVSVPVLWDTKTETIVSNESADIIRMFDASFQAITGNDTDHRPADLVDEIDSINARVYSDLNNGVYKCGFAPSQAAYEKAFEALFATLDWLEDILSQRRYLAGSAITEADWRLFPTLVRFDYVYNVHFKCNRNRIVDFPNLWNYARELYQRPGIAETVNVEHFTRHYYKSQETINPRRIVPVGPVINWSAPHNRDQQVP